MNQKKNKTVVYTAIINDYDKLRKPRVISPNCDYVCFTDDPKLRSKVWQIRPMPESELDFTRQNREIKLHPHLYFPEYEYSIYVDGNVEILGDPEELIDEYLIKREAVFVTLLHRDRDCLYDEAKLCLDREKDNKEVIEEQISEYKALGFPAHFGLSENPVLLRKHNDPLVIKVMEEWWQEVLDKSKRDQLSLDFVLWKNGLERGTLGKRNESVFLNYFSQKGHKEKGLRRLRQTIIENKDENIFWRSLFELSLITKRMLRSFKKFLFK